MAKFANGKYAFGFCDRTGRSEEMANMRSGFVIAQDSDTRSRILCHRSKLVA